MNIIRQISEDLKLRPQQIQSVADLLDDGNTLPFIARYRKEMTGSLDEEQLRNIQTSLERLRTLEKRRETILASIEEQEKLTPELKKKILDAQNLTTLEDLYLPYKPKRRTRAMIALERGLKGLAETIVEQPRSSKSLEDFAKPYLSEDVPTVEDAFAGARDIIAEAISDSAGIRGEVRDKALRFGTLTCTKIDDAQDEKLVYETYYEFSHRVISIRPYQTLAINRGEKEKILRVKINVEQRDWEDAIEREYLTDRRSPLEEQLHMAIEDSVKRLLLPAIERDVRRFLTEEAETHAIEVFAKNLRGLLSQPPIANQGVLGLDPGYRTGTKVAVIDATGKVIDTATIYPHAPQREWRKSQSIIKSLIQKHDVTLIAIGNGTASRETEQLVAEITRDLDGVHYSVVNEAGASVYSASTLAREELPDLDVTSRGAASIARRIQDPLAELVKIDPKSIGVGLYQHDVNQKQLSETLKTVVESVVNHVGVDLNTASSALLTYVAGIGPKLANSIVAHRDEHGEFINRKSVKAVSGLGTKAFEQAAGFLRVREGDDPLDNSAIHPESYKIAKQVLSQAKVKMSNAIEERQTALNTLKSAQPLPELAQSLGTGVPTLTDIFEQLIRPGRDPRDDMPTPILRSDVLSMEDLTVGMILNGTVRNVVDFGAFIDIGVKQDGLLHRSQMRRGVIVKVGGIIEVQILNIDIKRGRIGLGIPD